MQICQFTSCVSKNIATFFTLKSVNFVFFVSFELSAQFLLVDQRRFFVWLIVRLPTSFDHCLFVRKCESRNSIIRTVQSCLIFCNFKKTRQLILACQTHSQGKRRSALYSGQSRCSSVCCRENVRIRSCCATCSEFADWILFHCSLILLFVFVFVQPYLSLEDADPDSALARSVSFNARRRVSSPNTKGNLTFTFRQIFDRNFL